jgi:hypothetical protein
VPAQPVADSYRLEYDRVDERNLKDI